MRPGCFRPNHMRSATRRRSGGLLRRNLEARRGSGAAIAAGMSYDARGCAVALRGDLDGIVTVRAAMG
jgi:hypothetical protein